MNKSTIAFAATLLASGVAFAQPGPDQYPDGETPPVVIPAAPQQVATATPMTDNWSNVSHINGTPVPVGERNAYLYEQKKVNIATNPLGWMFGFYGLSASYAVHKNVAVRVDANMFSLESRKGYEYGISAPIYLKRAYSGPFIEPGLVTRGFENETVYGSKPYESDGGVYESSDDSITGVEMLIGWHSTFDSGLNMAVAVGAIKDLKRSDNYTEPTGYFRLGYAF